MARQKMGYSPNRRGIEEQQQRGKKYRTNKTRLNIEHICLDGYQLT